MGSTVLLSRFQQKAQKLRRLEHERARRKIRSVRHEFCARLWRETAVRLQLDYQRTTPNTYRLSSDAKSIEITGGQVNLDDAQTAERIGDKAAMYAAYDAIGIAALPHAVFSKKSAEAAEAFLRASSAPCVVKPARDTGGGQGVTMGIDTPEKLRQAIRHAATYCDGLIIEPEIVGAVYRLLYLDGVLLDIVRRDPPSITGDGKSTIKQLVQAENAARRTGSSITALSLLTIDADMINTLGRSDRRLGTVLSAGEGVQVKGACNQNSLRDNHHCPSNLHPATAEQIQAIIEHFAVRFAGIDLICRDISAPLNSENGYIFEVNTYPGIHHHFLAERDTQPHFICDKVVTALMSDCG